MDTCHHPVGKNVSTDALKTNMSNTQGLMKVGFNHHNHCHHHHHHPSDNNSGDSEGLLLVEGVLGIGEEFVYTGPSYSSSSVYPYLGSSKLCPRW